MGLFGECSVGRLRDRRFKLSPQAIATIKRLCGQGRSMNSLAVRFGVSPLTVRYYVDDRYREAQQAKNSQRRRTKEEEREQTANKQLRRDLVRHKVRAYTRKQMKTYRDAVAPIMRPIWAKKMAEWRRNNRDRALANQRRYWHRHKCKCHDHGRS